MPFPKVLEEDITIITADNRKLSAKWWPGTKSSEYSVVFLSGLGAPQKYLRWFASYLNAQGWGVLTFDYRGIGASQDAQLDSMVTFDDWVNLDIPAAIAEVKRRTRAKFLGVIAHSIGGQLLGQSPACQFVDGALFIASQRAIPRLFKWKARLRFYYSHTLFPILIRIFGYVPISKFTVSQKCPGKVLLQVIKWGKKGVMTNARGVNVEPRFADYERPLIMITISDDDYYASPASVKALAKLYVRANIRHEIITPHEYGLKSMGHFGFFHPRSPKKLWFQVEEWLKQLVFEADLTKSRSI
ncbi:alpha/beta fold hydrolase [Anabaena minutissima FACHB-250]|nr:alpha/beta fold hydrolase [Anabaena minutissima FACHB-250]